jgi:hypothetical protein
MGFRPFPSPGHGIWQQDISGDKRRMVAQSFIVDVKKHKVKAGESIDSLAKANGLTWQQLSLFNWETSVPEEINKFLREQVGCTKRTKDGRNYMFDSSDDPGIVYIPSPWRQSGLATKKTHNIRVTRHAHTASNILYFEDTLYTLPLTPYYILDDSGNVVASGKSDGNARIQLPDKFSSKWTILTGKLRSVVATVMLPGNREPLANEAVEIVFWSQKRIDAQTDENGRISLRDVPEGSMSVRWRDHQAILYVAGDISDGRLILKPPEGSSEEVQHPDDHEAFAEIKKKGVVLRIRLLVDPSDPRNTDDLFTLTSEPPGAYHKVQTVGDDITPGDTTVDLIFDGLDPDLKYSLEIDTGLDGTKYFLFKNLSYGELHQLKKENP